MRDRTQDEGWGRSAVPIPLVTSSFNAQVVTGRWLLCGWSVYNTATTAGTLNLFDGASIGDRKIATIAIAANGFSTQWLDIEGVRCELGVYEQNSGLFAAGVLYLRPASLIGAGRRRDYERAEVEAVIYGERNAPVHMQHSG